MQIFKRDLFQEVVSNIGLLDIVVVTGMRRVGKTFFMKSISQYIKSTNQVILDFENPLDRKVFEEEDYNNIIQNLSSVNTALHIKEKIYVFLDELQAFPESVPAIKYLSDHHNIKFFVTGSSSFYLKNLFSESLSGRKQLYELFPLNFREFLRFKGIEYEFSNDFSQMDKSKNYIRYEKLNKYLEEYLTYGGFPQVVLAESVDKKESYVKDIFKSYFEKDVEKLADFKDIAAFRDVIILLLNRVGSRLDITKIAKEVGTTRDTVYAYLSFLSHTYFIFLVEPHTQNVDKEISGSKKVHICDNGILNILGKVTYGNLVENSTFLALKKFQTDIRYYQRKSGAEVDFVLPEKKVCFEVKNKAFIDDVSRIRAFSGELALDRGFVVSREFTDLSDTVLLQDL